MGHLVVLGAGATSGDVSGMGSDLDIRRCKVDIVLLRLLFNMSFSLRGIRRNEMGISTLGAIVVIVIVLLVLAFFGIFGLHW